MLVYDKEEDCLYFFVNLPRLSDGCFVNSIGPCGALFLCLLNGSGDPLSGARREQNAVAIVPTGKDQPGF